MEIKGAFTDLADMLNGHAFQFIAEQNQRHRKEFGFPADSIEWHRTPQNDRVRLFVTRGGEIIHTATYVIQRKSDRLIDILF